MVSSVNVFVSATTVDLSSLRKEVTGWLLDMGLHPIVQDHFAPDDKTVMETLQKQISTCEAVIHIVGECYGAEPRSPPKGAPRRSYTQIEAAIARKLRKRLFVVLPDENFAYDPHEPEAKELSDLQHSYRQQIKTSDQLYIPCRTLAEAESEIRKLRIAIDRLRRSKRGIAILLSILLAIALASAIYFWHARQSMQADIGDMQDILLQIAQQTSNTSSDNSSGSQKQRLHAALFKIAMERGLDPDALNTTVDQYVVETIANRAASLRDQALAASTTEDYQKAEQLAEDAIIAIRSGPGNDEAKRLMIRNMHMLATTAAERQEEWDKVEIYSNRALEQTKPDTEAAVYAKIGISLGRAFFNQRRYGQAADAIVQVKGRIDRNISQLGEDRFYFLLEVARLQLVSNRLIDCENTLRASIRMFENTDDDRTKSKRVYAYTFLAEVLVKMGNQIEANDIRQKYDEIVLNSCAHQIDKTSIEVCKINRDAQMSAENDFDMLEFHGLLNNIELLGDRIEELTKNIKNDTLNVERSIILMKYLSNLSIVIFGVNFVVIGFGIRLFVRSWAFDRSHERIRPPNIQGLEDDALSPAVPEPSHEEPDPSVLNETRIRLAKEALTKSQERAKQAQEILLWLEEKGQWHDSEWPRFVLFFRAVVGIGLIDLLLYCTISTQAGRDLFDIITRASKMMG